MQDTTKNRTVPSASRAFFGLRSGIAARRLAAGRPIAGAVALAFVLATTSSFTGNQTARADVGIGVPAPFLPVVQPDPALLDALQKHPINPDAIYLRTGLIDTSKPDPALPALADLAGNAAAGRNFIIQLDGPMNPQRRAQLNAAGVHIGDYLPVNAFIVRLDDADPQAVAKLGFIRHHREYTIDLKLDPELARRGFSTPERIALADAGRSLVEVALFFNKAPGSTRNEIGKIPGAVVKYEYEADLNRVIIVELETADLPRLAQFADVMYVQDAPDIDTRNNNSRWIVQSSVFGNTPFYDNGIRGENQIVGVIDSFLRLDHCSFFDTVPPGPSHRKLLAYNSSTGASFHGTHVGGTIAGDAGVDDDRRGVAHQARIVFNTIPSFNEAAVLSHLNLHHSQGARIHTNSWGDDGTTTYNGLARGFDVFAWNNEDSLPLLAVTNTSTLRNPENAKNLLACGATQPFPSINSHCSGGVGPTTDGRRKPEIYAPGCNINSATTSGGSCNTGASSGTSMATPAIAGAATLARQYFTDGFYPSRVPNHIDAFVPSGALIKAVMLNSTADMTGVAGFPSNLEGWGRLTLNNTLPFPSDARGVAVHDARRDTDGLTTGQFFEIPLTVNDSAEPLRITLVFTDAPAAVSAGFAPVNDLDLVVTSPTGVIYRGNVFAGGVSVTGGTADDRNNVEQVLITSPAVGTWTIRVDAPAVNVDQQGFAIVASGAVEPFAIGPRIQIVQPPLQATVGQDIELTIILDPRDDEVVPGSPTLFYRADIADPYTTVSLTPTGEPFEYAATIPAPDCGQTIQYYASAQTIDAGQITSPNAAPETPFELEILPIPDVVAELDMSSGDGWVVGDPTDTATTGIWIRGVPIGTFSGATPVAPGSAFSPTSNLAWVTGLHTPGQGVGFNDIDNGKTTLYSPVFDLDGAENAAVSYARWFYNSLPTSTDNDVLHVQVTSNGSDWVTLERYGEVGSQRTGGWNLAEFNLHEFVPLTSNVQFRFIAMDENPQGLNEAAIDLLTITVLDCPDTPAFCPCDVDEDGVITISDYFAYLTNFFSQLDGPGTADIDADGTVTVSDYFTFLNCFFASFPNACP